MQAWFGAGYFPAGTMVAKDGGDQWVDVAQCRPISMPGAAAGSDDAGGGVDHGEAGRAPAGETQLQQRKRALGFGGATADAPRWTKPMPAHGDSMKWDLSFATPPLQSV